jgi:hypothetical protein
MIQTIETIEKEGVVYVVTRHNPECKNDFLQWQVGVYESRPVEDPIYETMLREDGSPVTSDDGAIQYRLMGYELNTRVSCQVFNLLGFGSNLKKARAMAKPKLLAA